MKLKRILSLLIVMAMVLSSMGTVAFADVVNTTPVSVATEAELKEQLALNTAEIVLAKDITITSAITTSAVSSTIDLNGNTLKIGAGDNKFNDATTLTIKNGTIDITGVQFKGNAVFCLDEYEKTLVTTLNLENVNVTGNGYSSAYGVFYVGSSSILNVTGGKWTLSDDAHASGGVFKADDSNAILNIKDTEMTLTNVRRVVTYANTTIENSTMTISGDANEIDAEMEHGFNRSPLTIIDSTISMTNMVGRGITAQNGAVEIKGTSTVTMENVQEATIDVRNNQTVTVEETANVTLDKEPTVADGCTISGVVTIGCPIAKIGVVEYTSLEDALNAASSMTGNVTIEILDKVTLNKNLSGNYDSITFVGTTDTAEIYLDVQGYITATGKNVAFTDLTLSKSEGGYITNAGFMNVAFGIYDVLKVTYTNCTFTNGAYASSGVNTFTECTFYRSYDKYGLWAYGDAEVIVDNCVFADYRGIKMYAEGAARTVDLTVKNTDFSALSGKPAIVLTYGESVTLEGNTYSSTGVFELDLDGAPNGTPVTSDVSPVCVNDNGACGVLVDGMIYTTVSDAVAAAEEGDEVTLLYSTDETATFEEGVILTLAEGVVADNVTVKVPVVYVAKIGDKEYTTLEDAVAEAQSGDTIIIIENGEYELPLFSNKELTFKGSDKEGVVINDAPDARAQGWIGSTFHFENLTAKGATENYHGLANGVVKVTYKDCNVNGLRFLYATESVVFENCAFNANGVEHSFWTYGASKVDVINCTFSYTDRAVNCYSENGAEHELDISFDGCTFTYTGTKANHEGAVEINSGSVKNISLSMDNCEGTDDETIWFNSQWDSKKGANTVVEIDDKLVWPLVAEVNGVEYADILEAIKAAAPNGTVNILRDITVDKWIMFSERLSIGNGNIITLTIDGLTINGNGYSLTVNSIESAGNGARMFYDATNLNINNLTINMADGVSGIGLKSGIIGTVTFNGGVYGVLPQDGDITINNCTFATNGTAIYYEEGRDNLKVTNNTFNQPDDVNVILLRGNTEFTGNTVNSGRTVNVVSGSPVVTGNNFNDVRLKVYNVATATIENNTINNLVFNDETPTKSTFSENTLSEAAEEALDKVTLKVAKIGDTSYTTLDEAFNEAKDNDEIKILVAGTYGLNTSGKNITITGTVDGVVFDNIGAKNMGGASVTFNNITFDYYPNVNYTGLQHSGALVYNNCTINGQVFLYGTSETFNKCTFNQESRDAYNVWTYDGHNVKFNECTFNSAGKSVLVYHEATSHTIDIEVTDCDFIATETVAGKAAIEIDTSLTSGAKIVVDDKTTVNEVFGTGSVSGNSLWNNKKGNSNEANNDITVTVAGETVLEPLKFVAKIGDKEYQSVADALTDANAQGLTDVTITLVGETTKESALSLEDAFNLYTKTQFDSVTFNQEDSSKIYYIDGIYTGKRNNGGYFIFDGVNIIVTGQYIFEGNVKLINNSVVKSVAEANCFIYNGTTTVEPGSKLKGVIDDLRGGTLIVDGGRTDGGYNTEADMQDAIMIINWSGDSITLKNGAYYKANSANEIGRITVNAGANFNVYDSKVDAVEYITVTGTLNTDVNSIITTKTINGAGVITIDASDFDGETVQIISADMSGFTGTVEIINNTKAQYEITDTGIVVSAKAEPVAKVGETEYTSLQAAINNANGATVTLIANTAETISIDYDATVVIDLGGNILTGYIAPCDPVSLTVKNGSIVNTNGNYSAIEINSGKLTLENTNIESARHGVRIDGAVEAIINGGEYKLNATSGTRHAVNVSGDATLTIKDGTFIGPKGTTMDSGSAVCVQSGATVIIEDGNFSGGKNATLGVSGTMTIYGGTFDQNPSEYLADGYIARGANGEITTDEYIVCVEDFDIKVLMLWDFDKVQAPDADGTMVDCYPVALFGIINTLNYKEVGFILEFEDPDTKEIKTHNFVTNDAYTSLLVNEDVKNQIGASSTTVTPDMYDGTYFYGDMMNMKAKYADSPLRFRPYAKLLDGTYVYGKARYNIDEITDKDDK